VIIVLFIVEQLQLQLNHGEEL